MHNHPFLIPFSSVTPIYDGNFGSTGGTGVRVTGDIGANYHPAADWVTGFSFLGERILSPMNGKIIAKNSGSAYGNTILISDGVWAISFAHCQSITKWPVGFEVAIGAAIATVGSTGNSAAPHCHMEVWLNGYCVNPLALNWTRSLPRSSALANPGVLDGIKLCERLGKHVDDRFYGDITHVNGDIPSSDPVPFTYEVARTMGNRIPARVFVNFKDELRSLFPKPQIEKAALSFKRGITIVSYNEFLEKTTRPIAAK